MMMIMNLRQIGHRKCQAIWLPVSLFRTRYFRSTGSPIWSVVPIGRRLVYCWKRSKKEIKIRKRYESIEMKQIFWYQTFETTWKETPNRICWVAATHTQNKTSWNEKRRKKKRVCNMAKRVSRLQLFQSRKLTACVIEFDLVDSILSMCKHHIFTDHTMNWGAGKAKNKTECNVWP